MLFNKFKPKSGIAIVKRYLNDIESALDNGYTRQDIYQFLCEKKGLQISFYTFVNHLRIARQNAIEGKNAANNLSKKPKKKLEKNADTTNLKEKKLDMSDNSEAKSDSDKDSGKSVKPGQVGRKKFAPHPDFDPREWDTRFK